MSRALTPLSANTLQTLRELFGPGQCITDPSFLSRIARKHAEGMDSDRIEALVFALDAEQICSLMRLATERRFAVTPRSSSAHDSDCSAPIRGGVLLCLERMHRVLALDASTMVAEAEPGATLRDLRHAAAAKGLFLPPDPGGRDERSIGGMVAAQTVMSTRIHRGLPRDFVLGLDAVLPNGELMTSGIHARTRSKGYDLEHLLVGSQGALGIITRVVLKLMPPPSPAGSVVAVFADLESAMACASRILLREGCSSVIKFYDRACLELVCDLLPFVLRSDTGVALSVETHDTYEPMNGRLQLLAEICRQGGASQALPAEDDAVRRRLDSAWQLIQARICDHAVCAVVHATVPLRSIAAFVAALPSLEARHGVRSYVRGYADIGNLQLFFRAPKTENTRHVDCAVLDCLQSILSHGGSVSSESCAGMDTMLFPHLESSSLHMKLRHGIKRLFDPLDLLNPGKLFFAPASCVPDTRRPVPGKARTS